ncbi:MAG: hypothetical protein K5860_07035 [Bacteroidales bacterium]|nr:hypothetical protein [Bacteroidales bacterium]
MKKRKCTQKQLEALAKGRAKRKKSLSVTKTATKKTTKTKASKSKQTSKTLNGTKKQSEVLTLRDLEMLTSQLKSVRYSFIAAGQKAVTKQTQNKMFSISSDLRKQYNDLIKFFEVKLNIRDDSKVKFL